MRRICFYLGSLCPWMLPGLEPWLCVLGSEALVEPAWLLSFSSPTSSSVLWRAQAASLRTVSSRRHWQGPEGSRNVDINALFLQGSSSLWTSLPSFCQVMPVPRLRYLCLFPLFLQPGSCSLVLLISRLPHHSPPACLPISSVPVKPYIKNPAL